MSSRSPITTHVLDTALGRPAAGIAVTLWRIDGQHDGGAAIGRGETNADGRVEDLLTPGPIAPGTYRIGFETAAYFEELSVASFYPSVTIDFVVASPDDHYHVPLLLSPFGYSTYRGS